MGLVLLNYFADAVFNVGAHGVLRASARLVSRTLHPWTHGCMVSTMCSNPRLGEHPSHDVGLPVDPSKYVSSLT